MSIRAYARVFTVVERPADQVLVGLLVTLQDRLRVLPATSVAQVPERELRSHVRRELPPEDVPTDVVLANGGLCGTAAGNSGGRPKTSAAAARATATPARSQAELTPLPPNGPDRAHVASPARGSDIWAAIDRRAPDIPPVIRPGIGPVIGSGIRSVIRPDIWPGIRPHIRSDIWSGIRPHVWPDIWPHIRPVIWPGVRSGIWSDIRSSVGPDIRPGPIAVAPDPNVGSPAHLLRRSCLRYGNDLCPQIGGSEDQESSQSENIHAKHLKLLNDSFRLGRPPRSATKTIQSRKGHSGGF